MDLRKCHLSDLVEDAESIAVKLNMMATKNIGGVAVWRLGYGTQAAWELINAYLQ